MNEESNRKAIIDELNKSLQEWENKNGYGDSLEELERRYNLYIFYAVTMDMTGNEAYIREYNIGPKISNVLSQIERINPEKADILREKTKFTMFEMADYLTRELESRCQTNEERKLYESCIKVISDYLREWIKGKLF